MSEEKGENDTPSSPAEDGSREETVFEKNTDDAKVNSSEKEGSSSEEKNESSVAKEPEKRVEKPKIEKVKISGIDFKKIKDFKLSKEDPGSRRERAKKGRRLRRRRSMSHIHISSSLMESMRKKLEEPSSPIKKKGTVGLKINMKSLKKVKSSDNYHTLNSPVPEEDNLSDSGSYFSRHDSEHTDTSDGEVGSTYLGIIRGGLEFEDYESHEERFSKIDSIFELPEDFITKKTFPRKIGFSTGGRIPLEIFDEKEKVKKDIDGAIVGKKKGGKLSPFGKEKKVLPKHLKEQMKDVGGGARRSTSMKEKKILIPIKPDNCLLEELILLNNFDWEVVRRNYESSGGRKELKRSFLKIFKKGSKRIKVESEELKSYNINHIRSVPEAKRVTNILMLNSSNRTIEREPPFTANVDSIIKQRIMLCCRQLYFSVGRFEPLFCKIALYNLRTRKKLTNDFHFHFNSKVMLGFVEDQDDELSSVMKYVTSSAKTITSVNQRDPDIVVVIIVCSIFGSDVKPYSQPKKFRNFEDLLKRTNELSYLSYFSQPIAFGYTRIFRRKIIRREGGGGGVSGSGIFSTLSSIQRKVKKKKKKKEKKRYATLTREDIRSIMVMQGMTDEEIDAEIRKNDDKEEDPNKKKKKKKKKKNGESEEEEEEEDPKKQPQQIPQQPSSTPTPPQSPISIANTSPLSATLRPDMMGRELKDGMEEQLVLKEGIIELSLYQIPLTEKNTSVMDLIRRKEKQSLRYDGKFYLEVSDASIYDFYGEGYFGNVEEDSFKKIEQYCEWDNLMETHFNQCDDLYPSSPFLRFRNTMYLYPQSYHLSTSMIGGLVGKKKQNISLKFVYRTTDEISEGFSVFRSPVKGKRCIYPKYWMSSAEKLEDNLRAKYFTEVIVIGDKRRMIDSFTDEIQICLPKVVGEKDHILVTVYNILQKKLDLKTRQQEDNLLLNDYTGPVKKQIVGFSFFPVRQFLTHELTQKGNEDDLKHVELNVYKNIVDGYLDRERELKKIGGRKINVGLKSVSSLNPAHPLLRDFYYEMMMMFQDTELEHSEFVKKCVRLTESVIPNLSGVDPQSMRPHTYTAIHIVFYTFSFLFEKRLAVIKKKGKSYGSAVSAIQNLTEELFRFLVNIFKLFPQICFAYVQYVFQIPNTPRFFIKKKKKKKRSEETEGEEEEEEEEEKPKPMPKLPPGFKMPAGINLPPGMSMPGGGGSIEESFTFVLCTIWITMLMGGSSRFKRNPRMRKKTSLSQVFFGSQSGKASEPLDDLAVESAGFLFDLLSKVIVMEKDKVNEKVQNTLDKLIKMFIDKIFSGFTSYRNVQERIRDEDEKMEAPSSLGSSPSQRHSPSQSGGGWPDGEGQDHSRQQEGSPCGSESGPLIVQSSKDLNERLAYFLCDLFNNVSRINLLPLRVMHYYYCKVIEPLYEKKLQTAHVIYESNGSIMKGATNEKDEENTISSQKGTGKLTVLERKLISAGETNLKFQLGFFRILIHHPCFLNFNHPLPYKHKLHCVLDIFVNVVIYAIVNNRALFAYDDIVAPYLDLFYDHLLELDMDPEKQKTEHKEVIAGCYFAFFEKLIEMNYLYVVTQLTSEEISDMMTTGSFSDNFRKRAKSILKQAGTQATGLFSNEAEIIVILKHLKGYERIKLCCVFLYILENLKEDFFQRWLDEVASTQPSTVEHYIKFLLYMLVTFVSLERPRFIYFSQLVMKHFRKLVNNVLPRLLEDEDYKDVLSEILRFSFQLYESQHCPKDVLLYYIKNVTSFTIERISPKLSILANDLDFQKSLYHMLRLCRYPLSTGTCLLIRECLDLLSIHHLIELQTNRKRGIKRKKLFRDQNPHRYLRYQHEAEIEGKNIILNQDENIKEYKVGSIRGSSLSKLVEYIVLSHSLPPAGEQETHEMQKRDVSKEVFFITHKSFISTLDLLNCFFSFHDYIKKRVDPLPQRKEELIEKVIDGLSSWIKDYFFTFDNDSLVFLIMSFINRDSKRLDPKHQQRLHNDLIDSLLKTFQLEQGRSFGTDKSPSSLNKEEFKLSKVFSRKSKIPNVFKKKGLEKVRKEVIGYNTWKELSDFILEWTPMEIARQWCIIEFEIFERIRLIEFFKKQGERENIDALTQRFNGVTNWVQTALVSDEDPKKRLIVAKKFIVILQNLYQLQNFFGLNEIVSSFNLAVIERLFNPELVPKTWPKLTPKHWSVVSSCTEIMSHDHGYKKLRDELANKKIGIPFIGLYQTDLVKIEIGNVDYYSVQYTPKEKKEKVKGSPKKSKEEGGAGTGLAGKEQKGSKTVELKLINLNKRLLIAKTLHPITKFQQNRYPFQKVSCLYEALKRIATRNDFLERKDIYALSLKYKKR